MKRAGSLIAVLVPEAKAGSNGTTIYIVGDYGTVTNMTIPNIVFDALDTVEGNAVNG